MKLSRQLFLVSLLTLSLPLAGFQYVRQMDAQLLQTQAEALLDRALSLVFQLQSNPHYFADLLPPPQIGGIQFGDLSDRPLLDGRCEDWSSVTGELIWQSAGESARYLAGRVQPDFYLCLQVQDASIQYHRPASGQLALGDYLNLQTNTQRYWLRTENPGALWAIYLDQLGAPATEYTLNAFWRETDEGYLVEIRIPAYLASGRLGVEVVENTNRTLAAIGLAQDGGPLKYIETQNQLQTAILDWQEATREESIYLLSNSGSVAARVERDPIQAAQPQDWLSGLYEFVSVQDFVGNLSQVSEQGFLQIEPDHFDGSTPKVNWYREGNARVARAYVPVEIGGLRVATLVADEPAQTLSEINSAALTRLLWYTGSAFLITSIGLIGYALWLSGRIRRLSFATSELVRDNPESRKASKAFRASKSKDELGELSRQYSEMVQRVDGYTQYLQSLSGKLSHEIRTPVAIVRSSLDNLVHAESPEERERYLERASGGIERLANILSSMSQSSAIESAIENAERESFYPAKVFSDLSEAYKDLYSQLKFEVDVEEGVAASQVLGSADLFAQMLDKLVDNAADFSTGTIQLSLALERGQVRLGVANQGPSLPEEMADNLFDSLVSVRAEGESGEKPHLGLGLFVVKRVAEFHRGKVEAHNLPDNLGVEFVVWLPCH